MTTRVFNCAEAKKVDLVDYLASLGHQPKKVRGADHWYLSPFRKEKTASFKVNRPLNFWFDHGSGKGGDILNFVTRFHHRSISDALRILGQYKGHLPNGGSPLRDQPQVEQSTADPGQSRIRILDACGIESPRLIHYLRRRRIPLDIAAQYCRQVRYELYGKQYVALGFPNRSGGYELRNEFFKASSSPKDISLIDQGAGRIAVFEGFFDFLSYLTMLDRQQQSLTNFLVLNSLAFFDKSLPILEKYPSVQLYLDSDPAGRRHTEYALTLHPRYEDRSSLYRSYKDLNDWLMYPGHLEKMTRHPKPPLSPAADGKPSNPL